MPPRTNPADLGPGLTPREAALDPIYRFVQALDFNDAAMLRTAFTTDAVFDISGSSTMAGMESGRAAERHGVEAILEGAIGVVGPLASEHHVSNPRVRMAADGREAFITAYAYAQHFARGQANGGPERKRYTQGNYYAVDVVREDGEDGLWKIKRFELSTLWSEGDPSVFNRD